MLGIGQQKKEMKTEELTFRSKKNQETSIEELR
jgi:hypothetical protein